MTSLLDAFPYPWADPVAQELHNVLCELFPTSRAAMFVASRAGFDAWRLNADQPSYSLWQDILELGAKSGQNRAIVTIARDQNPGNPRRELLRALISGEDRSIGIERQPRG